MKNQPQLIAYVDRLSGGGFRDLQRLMDGPLAGVFGGVHVLPFFHPIDGADAGFDPIDHTQVDARLGTWDDVAALARRVEVMADLIVNHVSSRSPQFLDFLEHGANSPWARMFLTYGGVFGRGASESDLLALHTPRPGLPFTTYRTGSGELLLWTTFTGEQIDIDVRSSEGRQYLESVLARLHAAGVRTIRLDAVGYAIKKAGTSCFMIPETFAFIADLTARARGLGMDVLVEVHGHYEDQVAIARQVDWVYDFALPPLVLHTLYTRDATRLTRWLGIRPPNAVTVLDTHDGIGVLDVDADPRRPDRPGLLSPDDIRAVVETIHRRSRDESRQASGSLAGNVDVHQINCTFYDALGRCDDEYLVARAIQCFVPGIPQVYYVGLLAGGNDMELLRRTGVGRDINRRYYAADEVHHALGRPVVRSLLALLQFRGRHAAFDGTFEIVAASSHALVMAWRKGAEWARLAVDLAGMRASITCSQEHGGADDTPVWQAGPVDLTGGRA